MLANPHLPPPDVRTMVDLLRHRAATAPDRRAFTFVNSDDPDDVDVISYAELDLGARAVAASLQGHLQPGDRVLVTYPPGLEYLCALFGCMYAGMLAVPAHPPDPARLQRTLPRLQALAEDADVRTVLTHSTLVSTADRVDSVPVLARARWIATDTLDRGIATAWRPVDLGPDDLAYLQYTSGSTSTPKGVMVSHGNLRWQLEDFDRGYDHGPDSVMVTWLPATHDLGLVYGYFMPIFFGFHGVAMAPLTFMRWPIAWLRAIDRYRGTHTPAPNFGYDVCALKTRPEDRAGLDLSSWRVALSGAERIRWETEQRFLDAFVPHGFAPDAVSHAYGMSESTAKISSEHVGTSPVWLRVDADALERNEVREGTGAESRYVAGCGGMTGDTLVVIADPETGEDRGDNAVGEIWVGGNTVAQGYWGNAEATEETFRARTTDGRGPFLRTGDLGFLRDGQLYLTGRVKDMIIIRGQNHYPQDIEWTVASAHPAMRPNCAAAFAIDRGDEEKLVVVTEVYPDRVDDPEDVFAKVRLGITEHGLQAWAIELIAPRSLPKTSSGKIQRRKTRELFQAGQLNTLASYTQPRSTHAEASRKQSLVDALRGTPEVQWPGMLTAHVAGTAARLLGLDVEDIDTDTPLRELGIDSVTAVELVETIGRDVGLRFSATVVFDYPTVDAIVQLLMDRLASPPPPAPTTPTTTKPAPVSGTDVEAMSDEEAEAALLAELEDL